MEGLELSECIYTLRGTRPRRIYRLLPVPVTSFTWRTAGGIRRSIFDDFKNVRNLSTKKCFLADLKVEVWTDSGGSPGGGYGVASGGRSGREPGGISN